MVPDFWAGVAAVIVAEVVLLIIGAAIFAIRGGVNQ